jgi:hypothetical protein
VHHWAAITTLPWRWVYHFCHNPSSNSLILATYYILVSASCLALVHWPWVIHDLPSVPHWSISHHAPSCKISPSKVKTSQTDGQEAGRPAKEGDTTACINHWESLTSATLNYAINYLESVYYEDKQEDKTLTLRLSKVAYKVINEFKLFLSLEDIFLVEWWLYLKCYKSLKGRNKVGLL